MDLARTLMMKALEQPEEVLALLHTEQQECKAVVDTTFQVGYQVLLQTKELLEAAEVGKLCQWQEGPFTVAADSLLLLAPTQ